MLRTLTRLALLLFTCSMLLACESPNESKLEAKLSGHDRQLEELAGRFYEPGMGDLMQSLQLRHAKLWFAGSAKNWELAAFELHEIEEGFESAARWHAEEEGMPVGPAIDAHMGARIRALEQSVAEQDSERFEAAFDQFTNGCNACHQGLKHGFIVIERPRAEPVSNQRWAK